MKSKNRNYKNYILPIVLTIIILSVSVFATILTENKNQVSNTLINDSGMYYNDGSQYRGVSSGTADVVVCRGTSTADDIYKSIKWASGCDVVCKSTVSDCSTIIQTAVNLRDDIIFKSGNYPIGNQITLNRNNIIDGVGNVTFENLATNSYIFVINDYNTIKNVNFISDNVGRSSETQAIRSAYASYRKNLFIDNNNFYNFTYSSLVPGGIVISANDSIISNNHFYFDGGHSFPIYLSESNNVDILGNFISLDSDGNMIYTYDSSNINIKNNFITNKDLSKLIEGIDIEGGYNVIIDSNTFQGCSVNGILISQSLNISNIIINSNAFSNTGIGSIGSRGFITIQNPSIGSIIKSNNILISNNIGQNSRSFLYASEIYNLSIGNVYLSNNIADNLSYALYIPNSNQTVYLFNNYFNSSLGIYNLGSKLLGNNINTSNNDLNYYSNITVNQIGSTNGGSVNFKNGLNSVGDITAQSGLSITYGQLLRLNGNDNSYWNIGNDMTGSKIIKSGAVTFTGYTGDDQGFYFRGYSGSSYTSDMEISGTGNVLIPNGNLTISNLSGSGNAFACVNSNGKLYRSASACA